MDAKVNYPNMVIKKSDGLSDSERYLIRKCQSTFLSLWSYPNPYKDDKKGKELCDVLAVFENHIFIFSDKYCMFATDGDIQLSWNRWYRHAVESGAKQIVGAERWLRGGGGIYLDSKLTQPFPVKITIDEHTCIHRIVVARGAGQACKEYFGSGSGSLVINTTLEADRHYCPVDRNGIIGNPESDVLFRIGLVLDRNNYVHVFSDYSLDCVMNELDTVADFIDYLEEKERLIASHKNIMAAGEEDILAYYLSNIENEKHVIAKSEDVVNCDCLSYPEYWDEYSHSEGYRVKKEQNRDSYLWDDLLERAFSNMTNGLLRDVSHDDYESQMLLFTRFAKPCRVYRRALARGFIDSMQLAFKTIDRECPSVRSYTRRITMNDSPDTILTILWLHKPNTMLLDEFLRTRRSMLEMMILSRLPETRAHKYHIGIAKTLDIQQDDSEDFIFLKSEDFPDGCQEIVQAREALQAESTCVQRAAFSVSESEYEREVEMHPIPYPW